MGFFGRPTPNLWGFEQLCFIIPSWGAARRDLGHPQGHARCFQEFAVYFWLLGQFSPALTSVLGQALHHFPQPNFKRVSSALWFRDPAHQAPGENLHFEHSQPKPILSLLSASAGGCEILAPPGVTLLAADSPGPQRVPGRAWMGMAGPDLGWWQPGPSQGSGKRNSWRGRAGATVPWDLRGPRVLLGCETGSPC